LAKGEEQVGDGALGPGHVDLGAATDELEGRREGGDGSLGDGHVTGTSGVTAMTGASAFYK
jgi:hypothetical protein